MQQPQLPSKEEVLNALDLICPKIIELNLLIGNGSSDNSPDRLDRQYSLVEEELQELREAERADDIKGIRDALADIRVVTIGYLWMTGITDFNQFFRQYDFAEASFHPALLRDAPLTETQKTCAILAFTSYFKHFYTGAGLSVATSITDDAEVARSNFSKFDSDVETVEKSARQYLDRGIPVDWEQRIFGEKGENEHHYYLVKVTEDYTDASGKFYPKGKLLKSINFSEPKFE